MNTYNNLEDIINFISENIYENPDILLTSTIYNEYSKNILGNHEFIYYFKIMYCNLLFKLLEKKLSNCYIICVKQKDITDKIQCNINNLQLMFYDKFSEYDIDKLCCDGIDEHLGNYHLEIINDQKKLHNININFVKDVKYVNITFSTLDKSKFYITDFNYKTKEVIKEKDISLTDFINKIKNDYLQ